MHSRQGTVAFAHRGETWNSESTVKIRCKDCGHKSRCHGQREHQLILILSHRYALARLTMQSSRLGSWPTPIPSASFHGTFRRIGIPPCTATNGADHVMTDEIMPAFASPGIHSMTLIVMLLSRAKVYYLAEPCKHKAKQQKPPHRGKFASSATLVLRLHPILTDAERSTKPSSIRNRSQTKLTSTRGANDVKSVGDLHLFEWYLRHSCQSTSKYQVATIMDVKTHQTAVTGNPDSREL